MSAEFSPWKSRGEKKKSQEKTAAVSSQDSVFYFGRRHARMFTSSSSACSSPQDQNLISGWTAGHDAEEQCGWLPLECCTRVFLLNIHTCAPQGRDPRLGRLEQVRWPTRGAHLLWQHNGTAVSPPPWFMTHWLYYDCLWQWAYQL